MKNEKLKFIIFSIIVIVCLGAYGCGGGGAEYEATEKDYDHMDSLGKAAENQKSSNDENASKSDSYNGDETIANKSDSYNEDESSSSSSRNSSISDEESAMQEIREQRERERQFREEDAQKERVRKGKYQCLYCSNKFLDGIYDECNYLTGVNGKKINTGYNDLMGVPPKFCSQACFDKYHEHEHQGHDYIP